MIQISKRKQLENVLSEKIMVLDGAFGTEIQRNDNTLLSPYEPLNKTNAELVKRVHRSYVEAGSDIISTNSFNCSYLELLKHGFTKEEIDSLNVMAAKNAKDVAAESDRDVFVAGSVGPTSQSLSLRTIDFDEMAESYKAQITSLIKGGVDIILVETCFDAKNIRAAVYAYLTSLSTLNLTTDDVPLMVSVTLTEQGNLLSGHSVDVVWQMIKHAKPIAFGLNCGFGFERAAELILKLQDIPTNISLYPNAGLPDLDGRYTESCADFNIRANRLAKEGRINMIGGCCGTTPEHIKTIKTAVENIKPRTIPQQEIHKSFNIIGERCNVAGSKKFRELVNANLQDAVSIAVSQVESKAAVLDVCFDHPDVDPSMIKDFIELLASSSVAFTPTMIDSSDFDTLVLGVKSSMVKPIVNSISLKEGETEFLRRATEFYRLGVKIILMLADEKGQADTYERKIEIAERIVTLAKSVGFEENDILVDPNVLTICTGIEEHRYYGRDYLLAARWITTNLHVHIAGGVSNLSFAFRGNTAVRNLLNSVFVHLAKREGLDYVIINPNAIIAEENIEAEAFEHARLAIMGESDGSDLIKYVTKEVEVKKEKKELSMEEQLSEAVMTGNTSKAAELTSLVLSQGATFQSVVNEILMPAMTLLGQRFEEGKVFLPSLVKAASAMNAAMDVLNKTVTFTDTSKKKVTLATVYGDVHDIGKNIVGTVLKSSGFEVEDLGIQVPAERIVESAKSSQAVCMSGLITPSLTQMIKVLQQLNEAGLSIPVVVGGAATSKLHTALKMATVYNGPAAKATTAIDTVNLVNKLTDHQACLSLYEEQEAMRRQKTENIALADYSSIKIEIPEYEIFKPQQEGMFTLRPSIEEVLPYIDWNYFFFSLQLYGKYPEILKNEEAAQVFEHAQNILKNIIADKSLEIEARFAVVEAENIGGDVIRLSDGAKTVELPMLRRQTQMQEPLSIADTVARHDYLSVFALTAGVGLSKLMSEAETPYDALIIKLIADRLTEATGEYLHHKVRSEYWGFDKTPFTFDEKQYQGRRMCFGYPACPDHSLKRRVFDFLQVEQNTNMRLTDSYMITPEESLCGLFTSRGDYFSVGRVDETQLAHYSKHIGLSVEELRELLPNNI